MLQTINGKEPGLPSQQIHRLTSTIRRQPAQLDRKDIHQQYGRQKHRNRNADRTDPHDQFATHTAWFYRAINSSRNRDHNDPESGGKHQLQRGNQFAENNIQRRFFKNKGCSPIPMDGIDQETGILNHKRIV